MIPSRMIIRAKYRGIGRHGLSSSRILNSLLLVSRKRTLTTTNTSSSSSSSTTGILDEVRIDEVIVSRNNNDVNNTLSNIIRPYYENQIPVIIRNAVSHFDAVEKWKSLDYIESKLRNSTTTSITGGVEIGGSYGSSNTERAEIPVLDYVQYIRFFEEKHGRFSPDDGPNHSIPTSIPKDELVYMAQNSLFDCLYDDIQIPDFCSCHDQDEGNDLTNQNVVGLGRLYQVMLWIGPRGCTSPMHYDPLDNAYMQITGRKLFILYPPSVGGNNSNENGGSYWNYAGYDGQQSNTSPVNPEQIDVDKYPYFVSDDAPKQLQTIVYPGDLLYVPSKWWHYVRSLDTAISVNAWWR